jgi:hypothetical protein
MSTTDANPVEDRLFDRPPRDGRSFELHSVVVNYENAPDRCTIYPRRKSCRERTEEWISANFDVFVDLAAMR